MQNLIPTLMKDLFTLMVFGNFFQLEENSFQQNLMRRLAQLLPIACIKETYLEECILFMDPTLFLMDED